MVIDSIRNFLNNCYSVQEYPALQYQFENWSQEKPLLGKKILDGTPVFANTMLKYINLIASGAELTVGYSDSIPYDPSVIDFLQSIGVDCCQNCTDAGRFDVILDCNGVYRDLRPRYGFTELTRSGSYRFAGRSDAVVNVDDSRIKAIETCLGTGEGFLRAMNYLNYPVVDRKIAVLGCGKVGRGVVFYAGRAGADVTAVDDPALVKEPVGGKLISRFEHDKVLQLLQAADIIVTATGQALALADDDFINIVMNSSKLVVNMGVEDEFGPAVPADRVLNNKQPLNFILNEPTLLRYIDPTMALHSHGAWELIQSEYQPGLRRPDQAIHDEYWQIVEKNGIIAEELSAAGL